MATRPGAWTLEWQRSTPVKIHVEDLPGGHQWVVTIEEDEVVERETRIAPPTLDDEEPLLMLPSPTVAAATTSPWLRAPHKAGARPPLLLPLPVAVVEEAPLIELPTKTKKRARESDIDDGPPAQRMRFDENALGVPDAHALRLTFTRNANAKHRHPNDATIWLDTSPDPKTGEDRHDYHVIDADGGDTIVHWTSISKIKERFWGHFDAEAKARFLEGKTKKSAQSWLDKWEKVLPTRGMPTS